MKRWNYVSVIALLGAAGLLIPVGGDSETDMIPETDRERVERMELARFSKENPGRSLRLLFIHHSCGGQLLADPGDADGEHAIYASHPSGGGLRRRCEADGYEVHEAAYASEIGHDTDWHHWPSKFRDRMDQILACAGQDSSHDDGGRNDVVMFKSCFPNNQFTGAGEDPGRADGVQLTIWNARAAYGALLPEFANHPETLFICLTPPPLAPRIRSEPLWKAIARKVLNRPRNTPANPLLSAELARRFNNWLAAKDGWLADYKGTNVAVFDYYDILTGEGRSNFNVYATDDGYDSHASAEGNRVAAEALVPFLNRCVRRAGLVDI